MKESESHGRLPASNSPRILGPISFIAMIALAGVSDGTELQRTRIEHSQVERTGDLAGTAQVLASSVRAEILRMRGQVLEILRLSNPQSRIEDLAGSGWIHLSWLEFRENKPHGYLQTLRSNQASIWPLKALFLEASRLARISRKSEKAAWAWSE